MADHPGSLDTAAEKLQLLWRAMDSSFNGLIITGAPEAALAFEDGNADHDRDSYPIRYVNPAFEQMTGYAAAEIIGRSPLHILQADERNQEALLTLRQALQEARECRVTLNSTRKDGSSEQREARLQHNASLQQLQRLSAYLQSAREDERAHIARELHDELGQILTALKLDISFLHTQYPSTRVIAEKLDDMTELVNTTLASVRRISADLRPTLLDDLGLKAAIEWLARDFEKRHPQIVCQLALELEPPPTDDRRVTAAYRIVQECLTNVARHAQASKVHIMLSVGQHHPSSMLKISVQDNGRGFIPPPLPASPPRQAEPGGFGLIGMRERVVALGGQFHLESLPGEGVFVDVAIPLPKEPA